MFELVTECADEVVKHFKQKATNGEKINIEMKDFFSRYTNDVIATCAFGIKINSFVDTENEFFSNGKRLLDFGRGLGMLKLIFLLTFPKLGKALNLEVFDKSIGASLKRILLDTIEMRQKNNIQRPDMINMVMEIREGNLKHQIGEKSKDATDGFATVEESELGKSTVTRNWTDNELLAQCFLFFFAGFETSSTMLTFIAYEIVANPDVQRKLYEEISAVDQQLNGKRVSYDSIQKMKYLDQVICETLRMWPAAPQTDRTCVKDYVYDDGQLKFKIEKGSIMIFPVLGLHRDPKYFPNPDKFDPERFSVGPRNCIGSRFALMELKAILYYLLLNFSFEANENTQIPLKMKKGLTMASEKGVHLELKPRK